MAESGDVAVEESCPQAGEWRLVRSRSESLRPFLAGLGVPGFVAFIVDPIPVELSIRRSASWLEVTDRTVFGENSTRVELGAEEIEKATRTKRKRFMLSATEEKDAEGRPQLTVRCRLFQRGEGWHSAQSWVAMADGGEAAEFLQERYTLKRPGEEDVVVTRTFRRLGPSPSSGARDADGAVVQDSVPRYTSTALAAATVATGATVAVLACCGWWPFKAQRLAGGT